MLSKNNIASSDIRILYLISPLIYDRHVDVVNENTHPLASRRTVGAADTFVNVALNGTLQREEGRMYTFN